MTSYVCQSLASAGIQAIRETADVCIVGAGAAGIYLASRLVSSRLRVILVEAGPKAPVDAEQTDFVPLFEMDMYSAAIAGRAFGLGGTTSRWGGQLLPSPHQDANRQDPALRRAWSTIVDATRDHGKVVAQMLGIDAQRFQLLEPALTSVSRQHIMHPFLESHWSIWLPFNKRNFTRLLDEPEGQKALSVYINAMVSGWKVREQNGRTWISTVEARGRDGRKLIVESPCVVICAGAIESTRIVLEVDQCARAVPREAAIGRGLSDHLSATVGHVHADDRESANTLFSPVFQHGYMRSVRLLEADPHPDTPRWFAHPLFDRNDVAFSAVRNVLQSLQGHHLPTVSVRDLVRASLGVVKLAWMRYIKKRLFVPRRTPVHLQVDMEQRPQAKNHIFLSDELDAFDRRKCGLAWNISDTDMDDFRSIVEKLSRQWDYANNGFPRVDWLEPQLSSGKVHGAYHPTGTCRLGDDSKAVLDSNLLVRGYGNLFVLSTAAFPSAGSANPTFSLLCLAERLASKLSRDKSVHD